VWEELTVLTFPEGIMRADNRGRLSFARRDVQEFREDNV
jgi:hypothetical protein